MATARMSRRSISALSLALAAAWSAPHGAPTANAHAGIDPTAQRELPAGVRIDRIARSPKFSLGGAGGLAISVARWRLAPGARFEAASFGAPLLVVVDAGELTLDAVGAHVSAELPDGATSSSGRRGALVAGQQFTLPAGASAFAEDGDLGPIRNGASDDLSLLVVAALDQANAGDVTAVPVESTPGP